MAIEMREPTRAERAWAHVNTVALVIMAVFILGLVVTSVYPWQPLTKLEIRVMNQPRPGESVIVRLDYCKGRAWVPSEVRWSLVDDVIIMLPSMQQNIPVGCHVLRVLVPTSRHVVPGIYQLQQDVIYSPWPWTTISYSRKTPSFLILPAVE